ncbi:PD-(D/E)XK nuclease family protein [Phycisphaerales bacterium AB-hyl4]|uniref:PD-(D/E)XK nuclease family protein n=1 Tax=Natronomicrosphaera hydrolytica TaxID=3242702 RepID=A0ABV4U2P3_9BACT
MPIERHFLDWQTPALPAAVAWLGERFAGADGMWDLSSLTLALPSAEAGRRLNELLVRAAGEALVLPEVKTPGELPELFYTPTTPIAHGLHATLARVSALREADRELVRVIVPHPPEPSDWPQWWSLATQLEQLAEQLATGGLRVTDVPAELERQAVERTEQADLRWQALAALEQAYLDTLDALGLADRHASRLDAIASGGCAFDGELILLGMADLGKPTTDMLDQVDANIIALVHAPDHHAAGFDHQGVLISSYWQRQPVPLRNEMLHFVDRPTDQAREVVRLLAEHADGRYKLDEITVGLGDEKQAGVVRRALELADVPTRFAAGKPLNQTRPAAYLAVLGRFASQRRFDDLAELLRHPDVERQVIELVSSSEFRVSSSQDIAEGEQLETRNPKLETHHWLTLLDRYAAEHLQGRVDGHWLGSAEKQDRLRAVWQAINALLPVHPREKRPLPAWSEPIADALRKVYGSFNLQRHDRHHEALIRCLETLAQALREQADLDNVASFTDTSNSKLETPNSKLIPTLTASEAIALTLSRVASQRLPEPGGTAAVELMGYLELPLDDAPMLVLTSMNEGAVPASHAGDAFLPDSMRRSLGLPDSDRRLARDLYRLHAIVHSRPSVTLLACRRSMEGEPLAPSRLLLNADEATLVQRVRAFYEDDGSADRAASPMLLSPGERDQFLIPFPPLDVPVIDKLHVTAFRAYLSCPYRFYLRHIAKLTGVDDRVVELDGAAFGTLAHQVLAAFGRSDVTDCEHAPTLIDYLNEQLDDRVRRTFGRDQRPAVRVQVEQLRERLAAFAEQQARLASEGWRIVPKATETELSRTLSVDDTPFTLLGRIDRIDHHPDLGYRIIDYKTSDTAKRPDQTHRKSVDGEKVWVDLQLPLYLDLAASVDIAGSVAVGYFNLPKKLADVKLETAEWDDQALADARETRDHVVRALRDRRFWPPESPPTFADEFAGVCADAAIDRATLIHQSTPQGNAP